MLRNNHALLHPVIQYLDDNSMDKMSFFLSTSRHTIQAQGQRQLLNTVGGREEFARLPEAAEALLAAYPSHSKESSIVMGAIPFDFRQRPHLFIPDNISRSGPFGFHPDMKAEEFVKLASVFKILDIPEKLIYKNGVAHILRLFESENLSKVVLSRSMKIRFEEEINIGALLKNLLLHNTTGYTFAVNLSKDLGDINNKRTLIGASPELLIRRSGMQIIANPLAGSIPRSPDPDEDSRRAKELLLSVKDRHEHAIVVKAVCDTLASFCDKLDIPDEPSVIQTQTMHHLSTVITGHLADPATTSLHLAVALHPTPAVCGSPTDSAREVIRNIEQFDRGFFTGMVGWCDAHGDGEWIIAIRCADVQNKDLQIFAGAGIVAGSDPDSELEETTAKLRTMLLAMGIVQ